MTKLVEKRRRRLLIHFLAHTAETYTMSHPNVKSRSDWVGTAGIFVTLLLVLAYRLSGSPWVLILASASAALTVLEVILNRRRKLLWEQTVARANGYLSSGEEPDAPAASDEVALSVVIPAFNEAERLPSNLEKTVEYLRSRGDRFEVIVSDDGSTDDTVQVVNDMAIRLPEVRVIANPRNTGKGYAVRSGVANSYGQRVLFADADGATPISEISMLEEALDGGAAVAIGSRAVSRPGVERKTQSHRKVMGRIFNGIVSTLLLPGLKDTQCGFKMFTRQAASTTFSRQNLDGFSFDVEVLFIARRLQYRIDEVPVCWADVSGSKVHIVKDSIRMFADVLRVASKDMMGRYNSQELVSSLSRPITPTPPVARSLQDVA